MFFAPGDPYRARNHPGDVNTRDCCSGAERQKTVSFRNFTYFLGVRDSESRYAPDSPGGIFEPRGAGSIFGNQKKGRMTDHYFTLLKSAKNADRPSNLDPGIES